MSNKDWKFVHNQASEAVWAEGLREIFEYRDLGTKAASNGDYIAHIVRANGKKSADEVQHWHIHECDFQFVMVLKGWAKFEYEGHGVVTVKPGDCVHQPPGIRQREIEHSDDLELLEVVLPADFKTRLVDAPA